MQALEEKLVNLRQSYKEEIQRRKSAVEALEKLQGELPPLRIAAAQESLQQGDTEVAEQVFDEVVDKEGKSVALTAYHSGQLAEGRLDYSKRVLKQSA